MALRETESDLTGKVVVITGGSSGIGLATARHLARRGCRLVLAARGERPLADAVATCEALGAEALAVPTDVREEEAVGALANRAVERFGRIDVWINNAGVIAYGAFEELPSQIFRSVIETNLMGQVHGSRVALARFRRQEAGTLINMSSVWGRVTTPDVSAYVASKFAVRALTECLRQEFADCPGIAIVTILPQAVDTPIFANAANYAGRRVRPIPPLVDAEEIAEGIVHCIERPTREVTYRWVGRLIETLHSLFPQIYHRTIPRGFSQGNYSGERVAPGPGNVLEPTGTHALDGGWRDGRRGELAKALAATLTGALRGLSALPLEPFRRRGRG